MKKTFFLKKHFQIIYGVVLIIIIPLVVMTNTLLLNNSYKETIDVQLQRNALSIGKLLNNNLQGSLEDYDKLEKVVMQTVEDSSDIILLDIYKQTTDGFKVIISSEQERIDEETKFIQHYLSWQQEDAIASVVNGDSSNARAWLVTMPMYDSNGGKEYLMSLTLTLEVVDKLVASTFKNSMLVLTFSILFLILLLAVNARIFGYAVLYRKIKEVDQMKDEFISIASHELRTPLTAIKGYVSMLLEETSQVVDEKAKKYLGIIENSTNRLGDLVDDLLNVSRIEQGRMKFDIKEQEISPIISEVIEQLSITSSEKGLRLKFNKPEKIIKLSIDHDKLKQVLVNIIGNAIKYTESGSITIHIEEDKKQVRIRVIDTGIGMTGEERERLFEKFYRIKSDKTRGIKGTGLGLWITKQIVENMNGKIFVDSIKGKGTDVTIQLQR